MGNADFPSYQITYISNAAVSYTLPLPAVGFELGDRLHRRNQIETAKMTTAETAPWYVFSPRPRASILSLSP